MLRRSLHSAEKAILDRHKKGTMHKNFTFFCILLTLAASLIVSAVPLPVFATPNAQTQVYLPITRYPGTIDSRRGPITQKECSDIGALLSSKSYDNYLSFEEINKRRGYLPGATEALNLQFFNGAVINSRTGSSPVCYLATNYIVIWPNPNAPATDQDIAWFIANPDKVVYLEFPNGRPEIDQPQISATGQSTETLYSMILAPLASFVGDIPIVGNVRMGSQTATKLFQIGEIGAGRLATLERISKP